MDLTPKMIRSFYLRGFNEAEVHKSWPWIWSKHYRIETPDHRFVKLNRYRNRLNFKSLKRYCQEYTPLHVYMSSLNWLMPERVGLKDRAFGAYPIGGEYVVDVDSYMFWRPHSHFLGEEGVCFACLELAKASTLELLYKIEENYSKIGVVFSGNRGFHIHVFDFDVRDWTRYNDSNPLKSHEAARFKYTKLLKSACGGFDDHHFTLSCDVTRVISFPGSLNAETGLVCRYLGDRKALEGQNISSIVWNSKALLYLYDFGFKKASVLCPELPSHPEPAMRAGR